MLHLTAASQVDTSRIRVFHAFRNFAGVLSPDGQPMGTAYFKTETDSQIIAPPDFSTVPDVRLGDIYCHCTPTSCQLWIWSVCAGNVRGWEVIPLGKERGDGRKLSVTTKYHNPSWIL